MIIGAYSSYPLLVLAGTVVPAWNSFKAVSAKDSAQMTRWIEFWIVFSCFKLVEGLIDLVGAYLPFYYEAKLAFVVWLTLDRFKGATLLYQKYISPLVTKHEDQVEGYITFARARVSTFSPEDVKVFVDWVGEKAGALKSGATTDPTSAVTEPAPAKAADKADEIKKDQADEPQDPDAPVDVSELTGASAESKKDA